ncbi:MAG: cation:proton antiporter [Methanomicrobiaceae archaeon]|nr:cation:proton antiporter [Methanomicrobiaceae archaeon]
MNIELWDVALLLLAAKVGGTIVSRFGQPSLIGELLAGTLLGALFVGLGDSLTIRVVAELGIIFLILLTMLSFDLREIEHEIERMVLMQVVSAAVLFLLLLGVLSFAGIGYNTILVAGAAVFGSSTVISARTLLAMDELSSREGQAIIGLQVVNAIIELLLISAVTNVLRYNQIDLESVLSLTLMIIGTFVVMSGLGSRFINWLLNTVRVLRMEPVLLALTLLLAFSMAAVTERIGITSYVGVMLIGILLSRTEQSERIARTIDQLGEGFFIPIFFASLGLSVSLPAVFEHLSLFFLLFATILTVRFIAYLVPLIISGYDAGESFKISAGLLPMSEYGLLMLGIGLTMLVLDPAMYSVLVMVFLAANILSPLFIGTAFGEFSMPRLPRIKIRERRNL